MKKSMLTLGALAFLYLGISWGQTGLPVWPLGTTGANNDVIVDFAHTYPVTTSSQIPNTMMDQTPIGTGVALDACGNLDLYFLPNTTVYATPYSYTNPACFQEASQLMRIYDKNGNSLQLCDPSWNLPNSTAYPYYMDACAADRELQVIPRKGLASGAPLQWFVIYNEPYQLQIPGDMNNGSYGYFTNQFPSDYRPSKIKYSLIEYDPINHPATPLRRIQPDAELVATPFNKPSVVCTYMQGKAVDLPDANGNYTLFVAFVNQLTWSATNGWSTVSNIVMHQYTISSSTGTISYVAYTPFQNKTPNQLVQNVNMDGFMVSQSSIEIGHAFGSDDYKVAVNLRNDHPTSSASGNPFPDVILFSKSFSAPPRVLDIASQRLETTGAPVYTLNPTYNDLDDKIGAIEWDPSGQFLYITAGNGAANANAYLYQLNTSDYSGGVYGVNIQNQASSVAGYAIGDMERGYANQIYITKTNFSSSNPWNQSPTLYGIDMSLTGTAFHNLSVGHDIYFANAPNYTAPGIVGVGGFTFMPDGIDGYDYSNGAVIANLDPSFSVTLTNPSGNTTSLIVSATTATLPSCGSFWWQVCETDASGNILSCTTNPPTWWDPSQIPTCTFPGYTFLQGHYYMITRGVWGCCTPWTTQSKIIYSITKAPEETIIKDVQHDVPMPDDLTPNTQTTPASAQSIQPGTEQKFNLYPNPSQGALQLDYSLDESQTGVLFLTDMTGRTISRYELEAGQTHLELHEEVLSNGLYLYSIYLGKEKVKTGKFSIQH
jgi:hypothetical protein